MINNRTYSSIFTFISIGLVIIMIINPSQCFEAASSGLHLWYSVVVPSLLPFFIISEIMVSCGGAALIGRHLSSMMRPLFGQPGSAALAVVMGFCSGFPSGAALTASLRQAGLVSRDEASRLVAFTNNAGPLYIIVAVSTVLLDMPQAAWLLLAAHYGINLLIGICLGRRRLGKNTINTSIDTALYSQESTAFNHSPGALLKNAAKNAATNIIIIGCFMVFFSVLAQLLCPVANAETHPALLAAYRGLFEMSLGIEAWSNSGLNLSMVMPAIAAQLAMGGLSVQMQVLAMISDSDISPRYYLLSRPLHAILAAGTTYLLLPLLTMPQATADITDIPAPLQLLNTSLVLCLSAIAILLLLIILGKIITALCRPN